jgi:hypothetical protein
MRVGLGFGVGPLRFWVPLASTRRRSHREYWTHNGCGIHHTRQDTADRCRNGRT